MKTYFIRLNELELNYTEDNAPPKSQGIPNEK